MFSITSQPRGFAMGFRGARCCGSGLWAWRGLPCPTCCGGLRRRGFPPARRAKACIVLFLFGGPAQHSTWDPKPGAPAEVRGELKPIATTVPGLEIGEVLPRTAQWGRHLCLLRAMRTGDNAHSSSGYYMLTGQPHSPMNAENANPGAPNNWPSFARSCGGSAIETWRCLGRCGCRIGFSIPMARFGPARTQGFWGRARSLDVSLRAGVRQFSHPGIHAAGGPGADSSGSKAVIVVGHESASRGRGARGCPGTVRCRHAPGVRAAYVASGASRDAVGSRAGRSARPLWAHAVWAERAVGTRLIEAGVGLVQVNWYRSAEEPPDTPCWDSHTREVSG